MVVVGKRHALAFKHLALYSCTPEREPLRQAPVRKHHTVTWNHTGPGVAMQRKAHIARLSRLTHQFGDLTIGGNHAFGNLPDYLVDAFKEPRAIHPCPPLTPNSANSDAQPRHKSSYAMTTSGSSAVTSAVTLMVAPR